jgi:hypothetical protein
LRNLSNYLSGFVVIVKPGCYIGLGDNTDHLSPLINDWNPPDLVTCHNLEGSIEIVGRMANHGVGSHNFADPRIGSIPARANNSHRQITICDDTDQFLGLVVFDYWERANILALHSLRNGVDLITGKTTLWTLGHQFLATLHDFSLLAYTPEKLSDSKHGAWKNSNACS